VDKVLAVFGRAEARDFIDLMALEPRYGLDRLCQLAMEKDRSFTPTLFAKMLGRFERLCPEEFGLDDTGYAQLAREVDQWRERASPGVVGPGVIPCTHRCTHAARIPGIPDMDDPHG
jgi:hypothetical protein